MKFLKISGFVAILLFCSILLNGLLSLRGLPASPRGGGVAAGNGDVNCDGEIDISDSIHILKWLFIGGVEEPCAIAQESCCPELIEKLDGIHDALLAQSRDNSCKRAGSRFVSNGDGTVTDICTGLMWQETHSQVDIDLDGSPDREFNFNQAWLVAQSSDTGGYTDWRLPTFKDIEEIMVFLGGLPYRISMLPPFKIDFNSRDRYWTSTEGWGEESIVAELDQEYFSITSSAHTQKYQVWLVRGED